MTTVFPAALDALTNPTGADTLNTAGVVHHVQHADANDAIEALEATVGITGSAVGTSHDARLASLEAAVPGITFEELDGTPSILRPILQLPNGSLTDVDASHAKYTPRFLDLVGLLFTSFTGLGGRTLQVKPDESGVEAVAAYNVVSLSDPQLTIVENAGAGQVEFTTHPPAPTVMNFNSSATNSQSITVAAQEWPNSQRRHWWDLTYAKQVSLTVRSVTAFAAGVRWGVQYSLDQTTWAYLDGSTGPSVPMNAANTTQLSGWVNITALAKAEVYLRIVSFGAIDATGGQTIGTIDLLVR